MVKVWVVTLVLAVIGLVLFIAGLVMGGKTDLGMGLNITGISLIIIASLIKIFFKLRKSKPKEAPIIRR